MNQSNQNKGNTGQLRTKYQKTYCLDFFTFDWIYIISIKVLLRQNFNTIERNSNVYKHEMQIFLTRLATASLINRSNDKQAFRCICIIDMLISSTQELRK